MLTDQIHAIRAHFAELLQREFNVQLDAFPVEVPPKPEFGDLALSFCMGLARTLRKPPRQIAQQLVDSAGVVPGVRALKVEGAGYVNIFLHRAPLLQAAFKASAVPAPAGGKIIVEHTAINPNKAAHIGHLRNAVLGDTLVRVFRYLGENVEIQNYIDDLGVQVADVVVGFQQIRGMNLAAIEAIPGKFDDYCWDLYAEVGRWYAEDKEREQFRRDALLAIEHGEGDTAAIAAHVADRVLRCHLDTMLRLGIRYDALPRESAIIQKKFWATAFELFKKSGAIYEQTEGKNKGCWVIKTEEETGSDDPEQQEKVIVRSNGAVTYVGKDMAYQLWKVGRLGLDFNYTIFHKYDDGHAVWDTTAQLGEAGPPAFGKGDRVYNLIDVGQSYTQRVVNQGLRVLGYEKEAANSIHFAYEKVALTPRCAERLGFELDEEEKSKSVVPMSGRRGLGVKADDLINRLIDEAGREVAQRNESLSKDDVADTARQIAVGALRYFMLKTNENKVLAFDIDEALAFEGETGPYLQNAVVRARSILRKLDEEGIAYSSDLSSYNDLAGEFESLTDEQWDLVMGLLRIPMVARDATDKLALSMLAKYGYTLAQKFHSFYHHNPIKNEPDETLRRLRLMIVLLFIREMTSLLDLMGISVPERM